MPRRGQNVNIVVGRRPLDCCDQVALWSRGNVDVSVCQVDNADTDWPVSMGSCSVDRTVIRDDGGADHLAWTLA